MTYPNVSVLIFSKNRPMQLQALLESMFQNSDFDPGACSILFKADEEYFNSYMEVWNYWPELNFWPEWDFKQQVEHFVFNARPTICFFTDDDVFKKHVNVSQCVTALADDKDAIAFSLRLGKNLDYCYSVQKPQALPSFMLHKNNIISWNYKNKEWDWNYPLSVDGHLFRREDFVEILKQVNQGWYSPNTFEGLLSHLHPLLKKNIMYSFEESVVFNIPHNKVQKEINNIHSGGSEKDLLALWESGKKIDIATFQGIKNTAAHQMVDLVFKDK